MRDRCAGGIDRRRILRGGTVSVGRIVSLGVLDCRDRWNVVNRGPTHAIIARIRIPQPRLIVHMPGRLAADARGVALRNRCRRRIDRRWVRRGGTVTMVGRTVPLAVLGYRDR